jgi:nicotinate phosphoribosyltransferase
MLRKAVRVIGSAFIVAAWTKGGDSMTPRQPVRLWPDPEALGPVTDVYELTMMAGYYAAGMENLAASFELFVRRLPPGRSYLVFAGLEQAIGDILRLAFKDEQIEALSQWPEFRSLDRSILEKMKSLRFEGDIWAVPEGTVVFAGETLLRVTAPLVAAQWLETYLLAAIGYPTLVASKAARIRSAAKGRPLFEFGARRGHGPHSGFLAARAAYIAGFAGTSYAEAARMLGIPAIGTMAHSWVQSFAGESESFAAFARFFPSRATLLVDTYDTLEGVRLAAAIDPPVFAIRIDSGDLGNLACQARAILDQENRPQVKIMASGDLDEQRIAELTASAAPIDGFGVGTEFVTSRDAPALSVVYKLVELDGQGRIKLSPGKKTYPMAKQVFRRRGGGERFCGDHVTRADEVVDGEALLTCVVRAGRLERSLPPLDAIRHHCTEQLASMPEHLLALDAKPDYPITYSDTLEADASRLMNR